ncbi:hypothetical protein PLICRDRAFT_74657, partial [Plicaturopsis crispa FD-325 SS-3]
MTQIVNALTRKSEMGGPMVCMYLMGFPDHYTNHKFVPFYWESFVREARLTNVHDYIYRPPEYSGMNLYDWISRYERKRRPREKKQLLADMDDDCEDDELNIAFAQEDSNEHFESEYESDSDRDELDTGFDDPANHPVHYKPSANSFLKGHPLYATHMARCAKEKHARVPNFLGAPLPRVDRGDREYYCSTMLTFFKPWRNGKDLRPESQTWDSAFTGHNFTDVQVATMNHFNVKYECLDARDDYSAQMKLGKGNGGFFTQWDAGESHDVDQDLEDMTNTGDSAFDDELVHAQEELGPSSTDRERKRAEIERVLEASGWTGASTNGLPDISLN